MLHRIAITHRLLAGLLAVAGFALPAQAASPAFDLEASRQQSIYHSRGETRPDGYVIDRGLAAYVLALMPGFESAVENLGPTDRWLDIGAGRAQAMIDYHTPAREDGDVDGAPPRRKASTVAMSIEDRRTEAWYRAAATVEPERMRYLFNKPLRDFTSGELGGPFQLISDVIGGFSYTDNLTRFMEKVLELLVVNGTFYTVHQDVMSEAGDNKPHYPNEPFLTQIRDADNKDISICAWLRQISCVEVLCQSKSGWVPPIQTYRVRKTCNETSVPALDRIQYISGTPPQRVFRSPAPARSGAAPAVSAAQ
ncbi:MAG: hypothetical protein KF804_08125 [Burkholderiales bacterium]|jgi:hypothetical protein|nr:hypothetical protein [Burkholderiales bacterium]